MREAYWVGNDCARRVLFVALWGKDISLELLDLHFDLLTKVYWNGHNFAWRVPLIFRLCKLELAQAQ